MFVCVLFRPLASRVRGSPSVVVLPLSGGLGSGTTLDLFFICFSMFGQQLGRVTALLDMSDGHVFKFCSKFFSDLGVLVGFLTLSSH